MSFRAFEIMANLAKRRPLRGIQAVCETQHQISTRKLEQYVEIAGNELADYAFNLRNEFDKIERERNAALAECERLRDMLREASVAMGEAHDSLFMQCFSNGITNAWGKPVNVSKINDLQLTAKRIDAALSAKP